MLNLRLAFHPEGDATLKALRLAYNPGPVNQYKALEPPTVRLAMCNSPAERNGTLEGPTVRLAACVSYGALSPEAFERHLEKPTPTLRLALSGTHTTDKQEAMSDTMTAPALLVSYVYLAPFLKNREKYHYRDWVMDSGAFSAHASGNDIDLQKYIDTCKELLATDPTLTEVYALDVIGDWRATVKNVEEMWKQGVPAIPCYHVGSPESLLIDLAKDYPKIALGGAVGYRKKDEWAAQCFARVWPCRIHGFGFGGEKSIMSLPWHSVDATNWEIGPCKYGRWNHFGKMSVRGSQQNLRAEVEWYLRLEENARTKWKAQMSQLESLNTPTVRLAVGGQRVPLTEQFGAPVQKGAE